MHFLFQLLLVAFILVHARAMRHAPKTGINTPQFVEGGFSVILHEDLQDYHLEALKLHVQDVHHSEEYGDKVGMVSKTFTKAFKGFSIHGASEAMVEHLKSLPEVRGVSPMRLYNTRAYSWGTDRIDQTSLPLDGSYNPLYDGSGVDVYVVDTGIDTLHQEFSNTSSRTIENIYNGFGSVADDTDGNSHGTHVSGTIGGSTIGVSSGANLFGVKVLSDSGSGSDEVIAEGLEFVMEHAQNRSNPAIISMSLGGGCYRRSCSEDPTNPFMLSVEAAMDMGIVVVVAAGNGNSDACFDIPAGIPGVITVGASDEYDDEAYFSSYGPCVDIYGPGVDINSACADSECGTETDYIEYSGTSMATPHVSGVVAQILENNPNATSSEVLQSMQCSGVAGTLAMLDEKHISFTPNMLLQVPSSASLDSCNRGSGCTDDCSALGVCDITSNRTEAVCMCTSESTNLFETTCSETYFGTNTNKSVLPECVNTTATMSVYMHGLEWFLSSGGDTMSTTASTTSTTSSSSSSGPIAGVGWYGSAWGLFNTNDVTDVLATDTLNLYTSTVRVTDEVCVDKNTCYKFGTSSGVMQFLTEWEVCGAMGGELFTGEVCVDGNGDCSLSCESDSVLIEVTDVTSNPGWDTLASVSLYNEDTEQWSNSVRLGFDDEQPTKTMCAKKGHCYVLNANNYYNPAMFSIAACGLEDIETDLSHFYSICIDAAGDCTVKMDTGCKTSEASEFVSLMDTFGDGWDYGALNILDSNGSMVDSLTLDNGASKVAVACLEEGRYSIEFDQSVVWGEEVAWELCGRTGGAGDDIRGTLVIDENLECSWECDGGKAVNLTFDKYDIYWWWVMDFEVVVAGTDDVVGEDYANIFNYENQLVCIEEQQCVQVVESDVCDTGDDMFDDWWFDDDFWNDDSSSYSYSSSWSASQEKEGKEIKEGGQSRKTNHKNKVQAQKALKKREEKGLSVFEAVFPREMLERKTKTTENVGAGNEVMYDLCNTNIEMCSGDYMCVENNACYYDYNGPSNMDGDDDGGMSGGAAAGIAIGAFVAAGAAGALIMTQRNTGASKKDSEFVNLTSADQTSYQPPTLLTMPQTGYETSMVATQKNEVQI